MLCPIYMLPFILLPNNSPKMPLDLNPSEQLAVSTIRIGHFQLFAKKMDHFLRDMDEHQWIWQGDLAGTVRTVNAS